MYRYCLPACQPIATGHSLALLNRAQLLQVNVPASSDRRCLMLSTWACRAGGERAAGHAPPADQATAYDSLPSDPFWCADFDVLSSTAFPSGPSVNWPVLCYRKKPEQTYKTAVKCNVFGTAGCMVQGRPAAACAQATASRNQRCTAHEQQRSDWVHGASVAVGTVQVQIGC